MGAQGKLSRTGVVAMIALLLTLPVAAAQPGHAGALDNIRIGNSGRVSDSYYRAGRYDDALESYTRAVKHRPNLGADVYLKLGNLRYRRQEREEAHRCWKRALELEPTNAIARTNLETARRVG